MEFLDDTICAPATAVGAGALSVIRMSGPDTFAVADKVVTLRHGCVSDAKGYSLHFGTVEGLDDVMVSVFRAPHSYTGEDSVEISCHASPYVVSRLLERLVVAGARMAGPGEFTRRAFASGKMDLAQAEAVADMIAADSEAAHRVALNQLRGGYSAELRGLRDELLRITSLLELELDFSEEEVEFADRSTLVALLEETSAHVKRLADSFSAGNAIRNGVPVAIVGAPNSGKSTLLNAMLGEDRAIVSDVAGTTRDTVEEVFMIGGTKFRLIDTAGLRETEDQVEKLGVERSKAALSRARIVLAVIAADRFEGSFEEFEKMLSPGQKLIRIINKSDLVERDGFGGADVCVSAKYGYGIEALLKAVADAAEPYDSSATMVTNARHHEALVRAQSALGRVSDGLSSGIPGDLLAEDLRDALAHLGSIFGEISSDDVLGEIFGKFCIGK